MTSYPGFRITVIHAITGIDDDDEEGVPAFMTGMGALPMIASNEERLADLKIMAQNVADETGKTFKIVRFSVREDIGEIVPKEKT